MENNKFLSLDNLITKANDDYIKMIKDNHITKLIGAIGLFPDQTITNDVLILSQNSFATCVKRMKEWNFYKRNVKKNEKAIKIITHYLNKNNIDFTDKNGNIHTKEIEKLKTEIGFVFDINQTEGKKYEYLKTNTETLSKYFDVTKRTLEKIAKGFTFLYENVEDDFLIDYENKIIKIKNGMTLNKTIKSLLESVTSALLYSKTPEGILNNEEPDINEIEKQSVMYAVSTRLLLDLPEYDKFNEIQDWSKEKIELFKENLQRVRAVSKQILANLENNIEFEIYQQSKQKEKISEDVNLDELKDIGIESESKNEKTNESEVE